jgi:hypothetical protein
MVVKARVVRTASHSWLMYVQRQQRRGSARCARSLLPTCRAIKGKAAVVEVDTLVHQVDDMELERWKKKIVDKRLDGG